MREWMCYRNHLVRRRGSAHGTSGRCPFHITKFSPGRSCWARESYSCPEYLMEKNVIVQCHVSTVGIELCRFCFTPRTAPIWYNLLCSILCLYLKKRYHWVPLWVTKRVSLQGILYQDQESSQARFTSLRLAKIWKPTHLILGNPVSSVHLIVNVCMYTCIGLVLASQGYVQM